MRIAAVTMSYNERIYLPVWCRYYGREFGIENIYVIDHGSQDGSLDLIPRGANLLRIPRHEAFDEGPRTRFVNGLQRSLLEYYDAVIYGDTDEIIIADPDKYSGLEDLIVKGPPIIAPVGLHVFQAADREPALDLERPILGQRRYCQFSTAMCKPVIVKTPVEWSMGFHSGNVQPHYADDVFLFHMKSVDIEQSLTRLARTRAMTWSDANVEGRVSHHHRAEDDSHLASFFHSPLHSLQQAADLSFDFREDVERVRSSIQIDQGFYNISQFHGRTAEVPDRFLYKV